MAQTDVAYKWGFIDQFGLKEYAGLQFKSATAPTIAAANTFAAVIAGMSECGAIRVEAVSIDATENEPSSDNASNYVASVLFQQSDGDWKPSITILGVKETLLQRDGRKLTLTDASVATLKAGLETLTGKTFKSNPRVLVYSRR